jgi:hypothetical protein
MIAALLLMLEQPTSEPMPPDFHVFENEIDGGRAFDAAMYCLAGEATKFKRAPTQAMIAAAHSECSAQTEKLREELVKVFVAHPSRIPNGLAPDEAANQFVSNLLNRFDYLVHGGKVTE